MKWLIFLVVIISSGHIKSIFGQEESSKQLPNPTSVIEQEAKEEISTPARQGPPPPGFGGLLSGKITNFLLNMYTTDCQYM